LRWIDTRGAARSLLATLAADPVGQVSTSVYETARVVALAPWLAGQDRRIAHLTRTQRADGGWGGPDGYGVIPTLSATDALFAVGVVAPARRGVERLREQLTGRPDLALPDLPASDVIVPALVDSIADRLPGAPPLPLPVHMDRGRLDLLRGLIRAGVPVDQKLAHALEVCGALARRSTAVLPSSAGSIGGSPAATAAWLGPDAPAPGPARSFLEQAARRYDGPVPCTLPITMFERAWVLGTLARAGLAEPAGTTADLAADLAAALDRGPVATAPGLPADADTTSVALYALARLGRPGRSNILSTFASENHFSTWPGEQGVSSSVNAHVLEAVLASVPTAPAQAWPGSRRVVTSLVAWLAEQQLPDGSWSDRWHASPYYSTFGAVCALRHDRGPTARAAVRRARNWVRRTQRDDGSWGCWSGTAEETAYALQIMALTRADDAGADGRSVTPRAGADGRSASSRAGGPEIVLRRGLAYLVNRADPMIDADDVPCLWHDKDLYAPLAIVRAAVLAAVHLVQATLAGQRARRPQPCA
jgi:hypothetical protein